MARPLRKRKEDGTLYVRRPLVEAEIAELELLNQPELVARCRLRSKSAVGFVSPEAVLYFVRTIDSTSPHHESLLTILIGCAIHLLPKPDNSDGATVDIGRLLIRDRVLDAFVDRLLADQAEYEEKLDYFEINFNAALVKDRYDASAQVWKELNRSEPLADDDEEASPEVDVVLGQDDSFDPEELDKKDYRRLLDGAIDALPLLQRQIIEMLRNDIPITSIDPNIPTISNVLKKSEKTIRIHRDRAYLTLRRRLERKEGLK